MAERTYLYAYGINGVETRLTEAQLQQKWTWANFHPEMQRRCIAMFNDAQDRGHDVGVGQAARSYATQEAAFLQRHYVVATGGCCYYKGRRYQKKASVAHAAAPGSSVHEDELYEGYALAIDVRGWENHWFDINCSKYGLKNFGGAVGPNVNGEEWHFQPIEFANSRSAIVTQIKNGVRLIRFPLPGDVVIPEPEPIPPVIPDQPPAPIVEVEDEMRVLVIKDQRAPYAVYKSNGVVKTWVKHGDAALELEKRLVECANGTKPSPWDGFIYKEFRHAGDDVIAGYGPIIGPHPGAPFDEYGRMG